MPGLLIVSSIAANDGRVSSRMMALSDWLFDRTSFAPRRRSAGKHYQGENEIIPKMRGACSSLIDIVGCSAEAYGVAVSGIMVVTTLVMSAPGTKRTNSVRASMSASDPSGHPAEVALPFHGQHATLRWWLSPSSGCPISVVIMGVVF
jgi:hypothetical protein